MVRIGSQHGFRQNTKATMVAVFLMFLSAASLAVAKDEVLVDRLVAEVNGEAITYSEVLTKVEKRNLVEVGAYPATEQDPPFKIALQDLINKKLIIQKVDEAGIQVTDEKVEREINSFLKKKGLDRKGLLAALDQEGLEYDKYFADFKNQMLIKQFQGRFIVPAVKISQKDVELFYFKMLGSSPAGVKIKLRQILIEAAKGKSHDQIAKEVHKKLVDGMSFEEAAKQFSAGEAARENGGLMPAIALKDLSPIIKNAVEGLEGGQFSQPIKVGNNSYLFYVEEKFLSDTSDFEKKRPELEFRLRQQEMQKETVRWIENQRSLSKIRIIEGL